VVDYIGIANDLKDALKEYTASKGRGRPTVDAHEAYSVLEEKLDELAFYDALANNEEAVREMGDEILKKIAHELAEKLRQNIGVDWSVRESVRAKLRLMVKRILRKYKYPPDQQEAAVTLVLEQAETLSAEWA
jgi:type I site-specific restriction-modification system R (restriction) subunit